MLRKEPALAPLGRAQHPLTLKRVFGCCAYRSLRDRWCGKQASHTDYQSELFPQTPTDPLRFRVGPMDSKSHRSALGRATLIRASSITRRWHPAPTTLTVPLSFARGQPIDLHGIRHLLGARVMQPAPATTGRRRTNPAPSNGRLHRWLVVWFQA